MGAWWDGFKAVISGKTEAKLAEDAVKTSDLVRKRPNGQAHYDNIDKLWNERKETAAAVKAAEQSGDKAAMSAANAAHSAKTDAVKESIKNAKSHIRGARFGKFANVVGSKWFMVPAGIAAATAGALYLSGRSEEKREAARAEARQQELERQRMELAALSQQPSGTMMGMEPVVGAHANRVLAARNGGLGVDPSNPGVNMQYEAVR